MLFRSQADEEKKMVAEQREHTQAQRARRDPPLPGLAQHKWPGQRAAYYQRNPGQQKRRHVAERDAQCRQEGPQGNGGQGVEIGFQD